MFIRVIVSILELIRLLLNHLVNIPLTLLVGVGKFYIVLIAFAIDVLQAMIYTKILKGISSKDNLKFLTKLFPDEKTIEQKPFFNRFKKLQYLGIFILASLPVYTGGICAAATLRYVSKNLNPKKSLLVMLMGSFLGCVIWVVGVNFVFILIRTLINLIITK